MPINLRILCLVTAVLCNVHHSLEHEIPRRSFLSRRAIDGTRGRKYFNPGEEGAFDSFGSAGGQYDPYEERTDLSDIRRNVPGEPGVDYPAYTTLPQTGFTCEGRSRGYYADEVAGCQVFHVCHDVLVSSFLCPIGSTFSQKLLTCDWWSKVDCASTEKYIDVNRNSYQQDDDEMIRNAYAMISLQSGTDVTKDGLVDPDRTGSIVDYHRGAGRFTSFPAVDTTGNDLRSGFDDYRGAREFLNTYNQYKERKPETGRSYQEKFHPPDRSRSPYHDSPIIRIQKISDGHSYNDRNRNKELEDDYRRPNEFTNHFQPSYAPTVPTVTTTTRRFYSPTVPTTYRPSTLAYHKLDQVGDSSDYFFSHRTKSFVTPPTRSFPSDDKSRQSVEEGSSKDFSSRKFDREEDYNEEERYDDDYDDTRSIEDAHHEVPNKFEVRVPDEFQLNRTLHQESLFDRIYKGFEARRDEQDGFEDIETRGSIGLGHALRQSYRGISIQKQDPVSSRNSKDEEKVPPGAHYSSVYRNGQTGPLKYHDTQTKPDSSSEKTEEETTEQYRFDEDTTTIYGNQEYKNNQGTSDEVTEDPDTFVPSTTSSTIESTIKATTTRSSNLSRVEDSKVDNKNSSKDSIDRIDDQPYNFESIEFLKPPDLPREEFRINVPDFGGVTSFLTRYSTTNEKSHPKSTTTRSSIVQGAVTSSSNHDNARSTEDSSVRGYQTTESKPTTTTVRPWIASSSDQLGHEALVTDIVPPIMDYNDGFNDFLAPDEGADSKASPANEEHGQNSSGNKTERDILGSYNDKFQFTIRDAVRGRFSAKISHADKIPTTTPAEVQTGFEKTVDTTKIPDLSQSDAGTVAPNVFETVTQERNTVTVTPIVQSTTVKKIIDVEPSESSVKLVTHRTIQQPNPRLKDVSDSPGDSVEAITVNNLFRAISPDTLKQIEETIEQNNSPYQVSLTVNKDEELIATGDDLISRLIAEHGKKISTANDEPDHLEVVKSVEPKIGGTNVKATTPKIETGEPTPAGESLTGKVSGSQSNDTVQMKLDRNVNTVSLLQLMAELLKLDRIPRPFAPTDVQPIEVKIRSNISQNSSTQLPPGVPTRNIVRDVNPKTNFQKLDRTLDETTTESVDKTTRPLLKAKILGQLTENFGQPLYRTQRIFDLPEIQRSLDFQTGRPIINPRDDDEPSRISAVTSTESTARITKSAATSPTTTTTSTTTSTATETSKTIVKTEFVPSIGFSFDTDEGREEYVEAILGGLIDEHAKGNGRKETTTLTTKNEGTFASNETSRTV